MAVWSLLPTGYATNLTIKHPLSTRAFLESSQASSTPGNFQAAKISFVKNAWNHLNRDDSDSSDSSHDEPEPQAHDSSDDDSSSDDELEQVADHSHSSDSDSDDESATSNRWDDAPSLSQAERIMGHVPGAVDAYSEEKEAAERIQETAKELEEAYEAGRSWANNKDEDEDHE